MQRTSNTAKLPLMAEQQKWTEQQKLEMSQGT